MSRFSYKLLLYLHLIQHPSPKFFTTVTSARVSADKTSSFTVQYLINSCGFPLETALSTSQKIQLDESCSHKHDSILSFLKSHGFSKTHIVKFLTRRPSVLQSSLEETLKPKIEFLLDIGFSGSALPNMLSSNPSILFRSLDDHLKPSYEILKTYLETKEKVLAAIRRSSWILTFPLKQTLEPNVSLLIREGVAIANISKLIMTQPRVVMQSTDRMPSIIRTVKKLGIPPSSTMFLHSVHVMTSMSESTWNRKMEAFKSFGWSEEQILLAFKQNPFCLACSEKKLNRAMDFFVNTMKLEPSLIISHPKLIMHALDTWVKPRYMVLKVLHSKKLIRSDTNFIAAILRKKSSFLATYVNKNLDQVPYLMDVYHGVIASPTDISDYLRKKN